MVKFQEKIGYHQKILDEIECSLALLEPPAFQVKPKNPSFKAGRFSGILAKYQPEWSPWGVDVFIPHNELKPPYFLLSSAKNLAGSGSFINAYPLRIDVNEKNRESREWQVPIFTMFSPADRVAKVKEAEEIKLIGPNTQEINIREGTIVENEDFKLEVVDVEYHDNMDKKRPKSIVFRITALSKYPVLRMEQKQADFERWEKLQEHSDRKSSTRIRRFFYKKRGVNTIGIGEIKITLLPIFSETDRRRLQQDNYVAKLKIIYP